MEAGSAPPAPQQTPRRGLLWGAIVACVALAASATVTACSGEERVTVPDVVGMEEAQAKNAVADAGLALGEIEYVPTDAASAGAGTVAAQAPPAGTEVAAGSEVTLVVAETPEGASKQNEANESPAASGGGSESTPQAEPAQEAKEQANPEPPNEELGDAGWRVAIDDSGTGAYLSPTFSTTSTKLFLNIEVSSASGGELTFDLLETGDAVRSVLRYVVPATSTATEHAFEPVSLPVRSDYRIWIWMSGDGSWPDVKPPEDIEWRFVLWEQTP